MIQYEVLVTTQGTVGPAKGKSDATMDFPMMVLDGHYGHIAPRFGLAAEKHVSVGLASSIATIVVKQWWPCLITP